jgi:hypothetical protein
MRRASKPFDQFNGFLAGSPADIDAVVVEPVRSMCWEVKTFERYLAANPDVRITVLRHLSRDPAGKIGLVPRI